MLEDLNHHQNLPTIIKCDNKSVMALAKNPVFHGRSKHIELHYHYVRDLVKKNEIELQFCKSEEQVAYIFTKPLKAELFKNFKSMLEIASYSNHN